MTKLHKQILQCMHHCGLLRLREIADEIQEKEVSVSQALDDLEEEGFVTCDNKLTPLGRKQARACHKFKGKRNRMKL